MNKLFYLVLVVAVVGLGYYFGFSRNKGEVAQESTSPSPSPSVSSTATPTMTPAKEFTVLATPFTFSLSEIKVKKGDRVKITFRNDQGMHDWVVDEFNVRTKQLQAGQSEIIEFVADKTGTFEYYCSVNGHRQMGMKGSLIVE